MGSGQTLVPNHGGLSVSGTSFNSCLRKVTSYHVADEELTILSLNLWTERSTVLTVLKGTILGLGGEEGIKSLKARTDPLTP